MWKRIEKKMSDYKRSYGLLCMIAAASGLSPVSIRRVAKELVLKGCVEGDMKQK